MVVFRPEGSGPSTAVMDYPLGVAPSFYVFSRDGTTSSLFGASFSSVILVDNEVTGS